MLGWSCVRCVCVVYRGLIRGRRSLMWGILSISGNLSRVIVFNWVPTRQSMLWLGNYGNRFLVCTLGLLVQLLQVCQWGVLKGFDVGQDLNSNTEDVRKSLALTQNGGSTLALSWLGLGEGNVPHQNIFAYKHASLHLSLSGVKHAREVWSKLHSSTSHCM